MAERIKRSELLRARRTFCRNVASALLAAMAASDTSFYNIDIRVGWKPGTAQAFILQIANGISKRTTLDKISDFALACGSEVSFKLNWIKDTQ